MKSFDQMGVYAATVHVAEAKSRPWLWVVALGWGAFPFVLRTVLVNPGDMIWLQDYAQGLAPPPSFTAQQTGVGLVEAVITLAVLVMWQLIATTAFYRRAALDVGGPVATPPLFPLAALLPGVVGNAAWLGGTGYFDLTGCLIGLSPVALTVGCEFIVNRLGKKTVNQLMQLDA
jgi:hypothetical protein